MERLLNFGDVKLRQRVSFTFVGDTIPCWDILGGLGNEKCREEPFELGCWGSPHFRVDRDPPIGDWLNRELGTVADDSVSRGSVC